MTPIPIGYFLKQTVRRSTWARPGEPSPFPRPDVDEICSVSRCISSPPDGWFSITAANSFEGLASPTEAWAAVPDSVRKGLDLFAFGLLPVRLAAGDQIPLEIEAPEVEPVPGSFRRLGWDVVEVVGEGPCYSFGCSPLSCNAQAAQPGMLRVNRHCLLGSLEEGLHLARHFSRTKPEPGPFGVVEIWRAGE